MELKRSDNTVKPNTKKEKHDKAYFIKKLNQLKAQEMLLISKINEKINPSELRKITTKINEINQLQKYVLKLLEDKIKEENINMENEKKEAKIESSEIREKLMWMLTKGNFETFVSLKNITEEDLEFLYQKGYFDLTLKLKHPVNRKKLEVKEMEFIFIYSFLTRFIDSKKVNRNMIDYLKTKEEVSQNDLVLLKNGTFQLNSNQFFSVEKNKDYQQKYSFNKNKEKLLNVEKNNDPNISKKELGEDLKKNFDSEKHLKKESLSIKNNAETIKEENKLKNEKINETFNSSKFIKKDEELKNDKIELEIENKNTNVQKNVRTIDISDSMVDRLNESKDNLRKKFKEENFRVIQLSESQRNMLNRENDLILSSKHLKEDIKEKKIEIDPRTIKITDSMLKMKNPDESENKNSGSNYRIIKLTDSQIKHINYLSSLESSINLKNLNVLSNEDSMNVKTHNDSINDKNESKNNSHFLDFEKKILQSGIQYEKEFRMELYNKESEPNYDEAKEFYERKIEEDYTNYKDQMDTIKNEIGILKNTFEKAKENLCYRLDRKFGLKLKPVEDVNSVFKKFREYPEQLNSEELDFLYNQKFIQNFINTQPEMFLEEQILYLKIKKNLEEIMEEKKKLEEKRELEKNRLNNEFYNSNVETKHDQNSSDLISKDENSPNLNSMRHTPKNYSVKNYKTFVIEEENSQDIENSNNFSNDPRDEDSEEKKDSQDKENFQKLNKAIQELKMDEKQLRKLEDLNNKENVKTKDENDYTLSDTNLRKFTDNNSLNDLSNSDINIDKKINNMSMNKNLSFSFQSEGLLVSKKDFKSNEFKNIKENLLSEQIINNNVDGLISEKNILNSQFQSFKIPVVKKHINGQKENQKEDSESYDHSNNTANNNFNNNKIQSVVSFDNFGKIQNNLESKIHPEDINNSFIDVLKTQFDSLNQRIYNLEKNTQNHHLVSQLKHESILLKKEMDNYENKFQNFSKDQYKQLKNINTFHLENHNNDSFKNDNIYPQEDISSEKHIKKYSVHTQRISL